MHRCSLALLSLFACTPASPPVEHAVEVVEANPPAPTHPEPEIPIGDAKAEPKPVEPAAPVVDVPAQAGTPIAASKRYPDDVYAALVDEKGRWSVDIIDFEYVEGSPLARALDGTSTEDAEAWLDEIPTGDAALPEGWATGDHWTLLTRAGTVPKRAASFAAGVSAGSGTLHFHVRLGAAPKHAKGPALAVRQRAPKAAVKLAMPVPAAITVLGEDALTDITRAVTAKLDVDQRKLLRKHPLRPKHVEVFAGRFPGERTHAIIVRMAVTDEDAAVSGLLFAKQDGSVELVTISGVWGELEMFAMVDLDGDGIDELVYEDEYHEGWYLQLLYWKKGSPKIRTLTGDGV